MYSPNHNTHANYSAGFAALILSGECAPGSASQFSAHTLASRDVVRSSAVSSNGVSSDRSIQAFFHCTFAANGPAYGWRITNLFALEFIFHPLSFFLLYIAFEGAVRFIGSLVNGEIVPSLLIFLFFKISDSTARSISRRRLRAPVADVLERLPDGRMRIASATLKGGWNTSVTIGINGRWFEVEQEEHAQPPRPYIYVLRSAPPGKILRGYQEYPAPALETVAMKTPDADLT